jgi:hypothetical protein
VVDPFLLLKKILSPVKDLHPERSTSLRPPHRESEVLRGRMTGARSRKLGVSPRHHDSGHNADGKITDTSWPVYGCDIDRMDKQDCMDCVNTYR